MEAVDIKRIIDKQREYFLSGAVMPVNKRIEALKSLKTAIEKYENEILTALKADLGKGETEAYMCEIGMVNDELRYMLKHVKKFAKDRRVKTPIAQFASKSFVSPKPYGVVLIMSPWNYPLLLTLGPLVDALAAGNTAVVKPSAYSPATTEVLQKIISEAFDERYVTLITGGRKENQCLLEQRFDYIMFTGSPVVGREVMKKASVNLTPITLELGGKSPCLVDATANIELAAKRIVFGKLVNCGQTCIAPDYIYCDAGIKDELIDEMKKQIVVQYGEKPLENSEYGKIINEKHFNRLCGLIDESKVVFGGACDTAALRIEPTIMNNVTFDDAVMQEEIFGPIIPVLTFGSLTEAIDRLHGMEHPLATYVFSDDKRNVRYILDNHQFGGGCINDTIIHIATTNMGFGGVGNSGMGSYHGKKGFDTFTHYRSVVDKKTWLDINMRYQPYTPKKLKLIKKFLK